MVFKHKTGSKLLATVLITGGLLSSLTVVSNADQTIDNTSDIDISMNTRSWDCSDVRSFSVGKLTYKNYTAVEMGTKGKTVVISPRMEHPKSLGAHCNLYNSSGQIVKTADWSYNSVSSDVHFARTAEYKKSGRYFAKGTSKVWYNGRYITTGAYQSPSVTARSFNLAIPQEQMEKREDIYKTKKMIPAIGVDDIEGYVLEADLFGDKGKTRDEISDSKEEFRTIPLYDEDCKTIIGEYRIDL